jgi:hypothetical protein
MVTSNEQGDGQTMSDQRLRRLEREAEADPAALVRLLRERLRAGALSEQDLRLAAYLGHAPAAEAIGERPFPPGVRDLQARLIGLYEFGLEAALRAQVALARAFMPQFEADRPGDRRPHEALEAVEAWIACPCEEHGAPCVLASGAALEAARTATHSAASVHAARIAANAAAQAFEAGATPLGRKHATKWVEDLRDHGLREDALWRLVVEDTLPWVLEGRARPARRYVASETYEKGERVEHPTFGLGVVVGATEAIVTIEFGGGDQRKLAHRRRASAARPAAPVAPTPPPAPGPRTRPAASGRQRPESSASSRGDSSGRYARQSSGRSGRSGRSTRRGSAG